jgi:hypothetical protein
VLKILRLGRKPGTQTILYRKASRTFCPLFFSFPYQITSLHFLIMVGKHIFVGCIAALSAVTYGQDDGEDDSTFDSVDDWTPAPLSIWGRVDAPFNFTTCAAPTEMETCWKAEDPNAYSDKAECLALRSRIDCALTYCWNRV